jgi:hypothetical protein
MYSTLSIIQRKNAGQGMSETQNKTHTAGKVKKIAEQNNTLVENVFRGLYHGYALSSHSIRKKFIWKP